MKESGDGVGFEAIFISYQIDAKKGILCIRQSQRAPIACSQVRQDVSDMYSSCRSPDSGTIEDSKRNHRLLGLQSHNKKRDRFPEA